MIYVKAWCSGGFFRRMAQLSTKKQVIKKRKLIMVRYA